MNQKFRIPFRKGQWLQVYIWNTHREFLKQTQKIYDEIGQKRGKDNCALYAAMAGRNRNKGEFGIMHFSRPYLGAGCAAHEIQHFMFDWVQSHYKKVTWRIDEKLAYLVDDVTRIFWTKYYGVNDARTKPKGIK